MLFSSLHTIVGFLAFAVGLTLFFVILPETVRSSRGKPGGNVPVERTVSGRMTNAERRQWQFYFGAEFALR